jgi:Bacterial Ig domain
MSSARTPRLIAAALAAAALTPATAAASTWTVDDDRADCPSAGFTSIQAAVNQAAPWDTVIVCPGLYLEQSTPSSGNNSPAQTGSRNGLTITKPLTIKGAGASKVTIRPALSGSLAGTAPYLRDGGGNVVTVSRQSLGSTDDNENFVDISGVTIESPDTYAEAGVAFFNTSGRIANSVVGPLQGGGPHGWGVIATNSLQGAEAGAQRRVTVLNSLVKGYQAGGVLFDDARGADGAATTTARSGMVEYGYVTGTRVIGTGGIGIAYSYGARGAISGSEITGNAQGVVLTDAETGPDPQNPATRAFSLGASSVSGNAVGLTNSGAPALAADTWWGCAGGPGAAGCDSVSGAAELGPPRTSAPAALSVPGATADGAPSAAFADPLEGAVVRWGETIAPVVVATDDFGVKSVELTSDDAPVAARSRVPYEFAWTPAYGQIGKTVTLRAKVTDASGQVTVASVHVSVPPITTSAPGTVAGTVPATLSLGIGSPASFGAFTPGITKDYFAATTATVLSTAGDATLSVADPSPSAPGHLVNGPFSLPAAVQVRARPAAPYVPVGATPSSLLSYAAPVSNDLVALEFKQPIAAGDALRTGTYAKSLTFTLSTTTP